MKSRLARRSRGSAGDVGFNMVPMVDVAFLLILFFILTSQIASSSFAAMELARPQASQAIPSEKVVSPGRVVVNVISRVNPGQAGAASLSLHAGQYQIDGNPIPIGDEDALVRLFELRRSKAAEMGLGDKDFTVEVRADRRVAFSYVEPAIRAAGRAGASKISVTALMN